jgi:hypothetical protein
MSLFMGAREQQKDKQYEIQKIILHSGLYLLKVKKERSFKNDPSSLMKLDSSSNQDFV